MRAPPMVALGIAVLLLLFDVAGATARSEEPLRPNFIESPKPPANPPEIGGSMFESAALNTVVLGWWQFDGSGPCDPQGWTAYDLTEEPLYFHVDGPACNGAAAVNGAQSMWCGQWASTEDPWCGWAALPGYGADWNQRLVSDTLVCDTLQWSWTAVWDSEPAYDYGYAQYWDANAGYWQDLPVDGGAGHYDGTGGPLVESFQIVPPGGWTILRYYFTSDGACDDEDGLWPTIEGALKIDDVTVACSGGPTRFHDFESESCGSHETADGFWKGSGPTAFGNYAHLARGETLVQEDPCRRVLSCMWAFFDDPAVTNYACGGWPSYGATPYRRWDPVTWNCYGLDNEVRSPWIPNGGLGSEYRLSFLTYRDLVLDDLMFYRWSVRTRVADGCPGEWRDFGFIYYGGQKDWYRADYEIGALIPADATEIQVALRAWDGYCLWGFDPVCHSQAPLFDQVRLARVETDGPRFAQRDIDMWQDNFPEDGTVAGYARCDMAMDILPSKKANMLPGDSLIITVTDPNGLAADNTGGRPGLAVYVFVKATDRYGNARPYTGAHMQSPDNKAWMADPNTGLLRWPLVTLGVTPPGWNAYRLDKRYKTDGVSVKDGFCGDLMDLAAGPHGPPYHSNEDWTANTGVFVPGDVVWYFFGAQNTLGRWAYLGRTLNGQGSWLRTNNVMDFAGLDANGLPKAACEWSVLPDRGRQAGDLGDILYVDDADDRGGPAQRYFDWAFKYYGLEDRVDRYDVLGPSSAVGNSLASRVKNIAVQIIGDPVEVYQVVLWNSSDLSRNLMGDGGVPNQSNPYGGEKSDDFGLCYTFLDTHPDNPGWAYWGDDVVADWAQLTGPIAASVKATFMNHTLVTGNQTTLTGLMSPRVWPASPLPPLPNLQPVESFHAFGGCPAINDFDSPGQTGLSAIAHRYNNASNGPAASLSQVTPNAASSNARFFLAGFGYDFIRDDDTINPPDYAPHLKDILGFFENDIGPAIGIDPLAMGNRLGDAYPNPFNSTTTIAYSIAERGHVTLRIYNAAGQLVRTLVDEEIAPRAEGFRVEWNGLSESGQPAASGVYFYKLAAKDFSQTKKMVLLK